jgi:hypothetical protein
MENKDTYKIEIAKRPWYEWLLWAVWAFVLIFTAQNAIASSAEYEPQAATIFWVIFAIVLVGGVIVYNIRTQE